MARPRNLNTTRIDDDQNGGNADLWGAAKALAGAATNVFVPGDIWINEFHYDNPSTDTGEFVEIAGMAGTDIAGWRIYLYNGSGGAFYDNDLLSGVIANQSNGFGTISLSYPANGLQNGDPDGIALVRPDGTVAEFISYDGAFAATNGPASGMTSTDVGVSEPGTTGGPNGTSIGRIGTGSQPSDFTWAVISDDTPGGVNNGQIFSAGGPPALSINDVTLTETDAGTVTFTFTVSLSVPAGAGGVTFDIATADGTGTVADNDYVARTLTSQTIPQNSQTYTFDVTVNADDLPEGSDTFFVNVTNVSGATVTDGQGLGTITNDDAIGTLSIGDVTLAEGNSGTTAFSFLVTRSGGDDGTIGATWTLTLPGGAGGADGGDVDGAQPLTGTVSFADGQTSQTITIDVLGDTDFEPTETFSLDLSLATGGTSITNDHATGTITNDDAAPAGTFSIDDVSHAEGDGGATTYTFTVSRNGGSAGAVTVDYTIDALGGAGNADSNDFVSGSVFGGQLSFADGVTSQTISIDVQGDTVFEPDEAFTVTLSNAMGGATIGDGSGAGTIVNDDISVSIADAAIVEGDSGTTILQLTVTRTGGTAAFSVDFATADGGAPLHAAATAGSDYDAQSGTLNFGVGQMSATIDIVVNGDTLDELSEELTVTLSNASNGATIVDGSAIGTITTDDVSGTVPSGVWINEFHYDDASTDSGEFIEIAGTAGTSLAGWSLALYNGSPAQRSVYATINLSGSLPNQAGGFGTLSFAATGIQNGGAGAAGEPDGIALVNNLGQVVEFISYEGAFTAASGPAAGMTSTNVGVFEPGDAEGTSIGHSGGPASSWVLFTDDTPAAINTGQSIGPAPTIAVSDVSVNEADGTMTFTVTRSNVVPGAFSVDYEIADGTAHSGSDYFPDSGVLIFADNQTEATVTIPILDDGVAEFDETLFLNLTNPTNGALLGDNQAVGTIVNDDGPPITLSIDNVVQAEGLSGTTTFTFTVTRSGGTGAFSVDFATADGTATVADGDYVANGGTLNFGVGELSQTISVTVNGDANPESLESFAVNLSNPSPGVILIDGSGSGSILDGAGTLDFIHDIQGTAYFSPLLTGEGITSFNVASAGFVTVSAIITAVDNVGPRQGFYIQEEIADWDGNSFTSEGIFVMTRNDAGVGTAVSGVAVGDLVTVSAQVMEYQGFSTNMPITALVNPSAIIVQSSGNALPAFLLDASQHIPSAIMTAVTPDYTDSSDDSGDSFDASLYGLSYWETVEGMLVTIPDMVVADGFVSLSGGRPILQAYSAVHADADQINSRGGYTIAGDPPHSPPDTANPEDGTNFGGQVLHDGDINPDIIELDWSGWADAPPTGLSTGASMGDQLGDVTGIVDFDFTDRKLFVTDVEPGGFVDGTTSQETTALGGDSRSLTVATFNVENLDPGDGPARFTALANAIANNLHAPDIISIEEMQDNNGAGAGDGTSLTGTDASTTWQMLVNALNLATGAHYQWVDELPTYNSEGGEQSGNIRVGFLYNTDRVQLGDLDANATITERREFTDRIGDGVRDSGDQIAFDDSMIAGEIDTTDWTTTRRSLLGEFTFNGNTVYVTANHWPSRLGSGDFWQFNQDVAAGNPVNGDWDQRNEVAQDVYAMLNEIQAGNPNAGIVSGGDYNEFYFSRPLEVLTGYVLPDGSVRSGGARFDNLTLTLAEAERYTYAFDGRSQAIDHVIVNDLLAGVASYDVVHLNTGFNPTGSPALSDHDPAVSSFDFRNLAELLTGTAGADAIDGFGGDDQINGGAGDDILVGGTGADTMAGGTNNDWYFIDNAGDVVVDAAGEGTDRVFAGTSWTLSAGASVEIFSTDFHTGTDAIDLTGNGLANTIIGNDGANVLDGKAGADALAGRLGDDFFYVDNLADRVVEATGQGSDRVFASVSWTLGAGASVETISTDNNTGTGAINLSGNELANSIFGNDGANILDGRGGADTLVGRLGNDWFYVDNAGDQVVDAVGEGADRVFASVSWTLSTGAEVELFSTDFHAGTGAINLTGNELANTIFGNDGVNILDGKAGSDILIGRAGADTFAFTTALGVNNVDRLDEFSAGSDRIALDDAVFTAIGGTGALNANAFVTGAAAQDANDRIVYNQATGQLFYDADGDGAGAAVLFATLQAHPALAASDFVVI